MLTEIETHLYSSTKPQSLSRILGLEICANSFCASLILRYFRRATSIEPGTTFQISSLFDQLQIAPRFKRMFHFLLNHLVTVGWLALEGETCTFLKRNQDLTPEEWLIKIRLLYPKFHLFFSFLERCAQSYPDVLSNRKSSTEVLFPADNPFILKKVYENTPKLGHEELYLHLAKEYLRYTLKPGARLVEIGGGQGLLTEVLLPELHESLGSYLFTDIGSSFVKEAKLTWKAYPKLEVAQLDASKNPLEQGIQEPCDTLVGFNVVHATPNIYQTIQELLKCVKSGGSICLVETVRQQAWIDMIYGLTDGWWLFEDTRAHSPLLSIDEWTKLLPTAKVYPLEEAKRRETDTALIILENAV